MTESKIDISQITINDLEALRTISIQTFTDTFAQQNSESDMLQYISDNLSREKLTKELNTVNSSFYFLKLNSQIIGYLKLNRGNAQTELKNANALEIERIYIKHEFQGKKFGEILLQKSIEIARTFKLQYIWLAVWEQNLKAIAFYKKHRFLEFDKHTFKLGDDVQLDIMMKLEL